MNACPSGSAGVIIAKAEALAYLEAGCLLARVNACPSDSVGVIVAGAEGCGVPRHRRNPTHRGRLR